MTWIPWFYAAIAVLSFAVGIVNLRNALTNEKIYAAGTLLMPLGFALWAYGYKSGFAYRSARIVEAGTLCCLVGLVLYVAQTIRHNKTPR